MRSLLLVCLGACGFSGATFDPTGDGGVPIDHPEGIDTAPSDDAIAMVDAGQTLDAAPPIDGPPACTTFSSLVDTCTLTYVTIALSAGGKKYNTDTHTLSDPNGDNGVVLVGVVDVNGMDIWPVNDLDTSGHDLRVVGSRPFAIIANGTLTIGAAIDASSSDGDQNPIIAGAGSATNATCGGASGKDALAHNGGAPGGGGGAFQGNGGNGGNSDSNGGTQGVGAAGGVKIAVPATLRGGCPGGDGGATNMAGASPGGPGGGAVHLAAKTTILFKGAGKVNTGGGGGAGGRVSDGGGAGGGAGGMIVVDSPIVTMMANSVLAANGGGGGGGYGGGGATNGAPGKSGAPSATPAGGGAGAGGAASTSGAQGGAGGSVDGGGVGGTPAGGGGGGGGGVGYIRVHGTLAAGGTISPPVTP